MKINKYVFIYALVAAIFLFLRLDHFEESVNFGTDQGHTILESYKVYKTRSFTLIDTAGASWTIAGRYIFFSSWPNYLILPVLLVSHWDPVAVSYFYTVLLLLVLTFIYYGICFILKKPKIGIIFVLIYAFWPFMIEHSRYIWHSNLLIYLSTFLLMIILLSGKKKNNRILGLLIGLSWGLGFITHFSYILAMITSLVFLYILKGITKKNLFFIFLGFVLSASPLIIFDLRHNFYTVNTILFLWQESKKAGVQKPFSFSPHYLYPVVPFIVYAICLVMVWLLKRKRKLAVFIIALFVIYSLYDVLPVPTHGFTMAEGWNYLGLRKAENIILKEKKDKYNIVDILTGDSRALALRALLTVAGQPPLSVTDYPRTNDLFIYSKVPIAEIAAGNMWEIDVLRPFRLIKTWPIQNGINLYLVRRKAPPLD